jgi:ABC-type polysaccharide/polyol phosphate transport system ATPase subunit
MSAPGRIEFSHVWKKFRRGDLHNSLRDLVPALAMRAWQGSRQENPLATGEFWAVSDVSFEVEPGQALGIIGPNGAGKSTILKLLTRIFRPTSGRVSVQGRVGSLIEVAAGFHPDLTGRENTYLQGAIRGMRRREIAAKFDSIIELAQLGEFVDTPVKRYSSGMNARLGFSIGVHLDPDVLIIDEALSVGDYAFQQQAFERIGSMVARDIPVVLVSHQLDRIVELCSQAILLDRGQVICHGSPRECVDTYLSRGVSPNPQGAGHIALSLADIAILSPMPVQSGRRVQVRLSGQVRSTAVLHYAVALRVRAFDDRRVIFGTDSRREGLRLPTDGTFEIQVELEANMGRGLYTIESAVWDWHKGRDVVAGPQAVLYVSPEHNFHGSVNLRPRIRIVVDEQIASPL